VLVAYLFVLFSCPKTQAQKKIRNAAFLVLDGVYNSELMAPYDILHHSIFRDSTNYIRPFIVSPNGYQITTFEGITVNSHYSFKNSPKVDILVVPSTEGSLDKDLTNTHYINWLKEKAIEAEFVITACDGAFPLAATGLLDGKMATTFPGDRAVLAKQFPKIDVRYDVNFVAHGKFITSVGGALSYEPALYLLERIYSRENTVKTAKGMVLEWDLNKIRHLIVE